MIRLPIPTHAGALAGAFLLVSCNDLRDELPREIAVESRIASASDGVFMESCNNAIFQLSERTAAQIQREGSAFFEKTTASGRHRYSAWIETPVRVAEGDYIPTGLPVHPCGDQFDFPAAAIEGALRTPGNFYALTANHEGMLLVAPRQRLAAVFYIG